MRANRSNNHLEALHLQLHPGAARRGQGSVGNQESVREKLYFIFIDNPGFQFLIVSLKTIPLLCDLVDGQVP